MILGKIYSKPKSSSVFIHFKIFYYLNEKQYG